LTDADKAQLLSDLKYAPAWIAAIAHVREVGRISNKEYCQLTGATDRTALRDLAEPLEKQVLRKVGRTGRDAYYVTWSRSDKPDMNPT
jgi:Fic family protein